MTEWVGPISESADRNTIPDDRLSIPTALRYIAGGRLPWTLRMLVQHHEKRSACGSQSA
jgi:hypothetical protein